MSHPVNMSRSATLRPLFICLAMVLTAGSAGAQPADAPEIKTEWVFSTDAALPGTVTHAALKVSLRGGYHVQSNKPLDDFLIPTQLTVEPPAGVSVREIVYPESVTFEIAGDKALVFESDFVVGVALSVDESVAAGTYPLAGKLRYQACNDRMCLAPAVVDIKTELNVVAADTTLASINSDVFSGITFSENPVPIDDQPKPDEGPTGTVSPGVDCDVVAELAKFDILATGEYMNAKEFIAFMDAAESGTFKRNVLEGKGPWAIVALVIIGGVLLNLTPCVLPLIPINLAIIGAGAQAGSRARGFALGGTYGLAMALVYGVLGLIVTLTAATFGEINSSALFNLAIAALFVVLALAMFDVIAIDFTKYQGKVDATRMAKRGTFALAFFMGAVSALLAGACVAPVVIQVVVYAGDQYARGSTIALALPFCLGLGMALPWPFAGAGLSLLPKPGTWMVRVKQAMGLFILAFAAYYAWTAWEIYDSKRVDPELTRTAVHEQLEGGWTADICGGLAQARAEDKLVLIDMWATWCKNCYVMDRTTFRDDQVVERLEDYVKIKFQAEVPGESPARDVLQHFEGKGLPTIAILRPRTGEVAGDQGAAAR